MFSGIFKKTLAISAAAAFSSSFLFSADFKDSLEKLTYLKSLQSYSFSWQKPNTLVYFYSKPEIDTRTKALEDLQQRSEKFEYKLQKLYIEPGESQEALKETLKISEEELKLRIQYKSNFVYIGKDDIYKAPLGIPEKDIDGWVSKCQAPWIPIGKLSDFYSICRRFILHEQDYVIVMNGLEDSEKALTEHFSRIKYKVPVINLTGDLGAELRLVEKGLFLVRLTSIYDGDFDNSQSSQLKFIKFTGEFSLDGLVEFAKTKSIPAIIVCNSFEKVSSMFQVVFSGSRKILYVMTSNIKSDSDIYREWIQSLYKIKEKYGDQFTIAIVPNDEIGRKLSLIRSKRLRNFRVPEIRFVDLCKLISTQEINNEFPITDCSSDLKLCSDLNDTSYPLRNNFDKLLTYENLDSFISQSLKGEFKHHYELDTTPSTHVRKLCTHNFKQEVLDSEQDVLVELYGKYCPGCIGFKQSFSEIAEEMQTDKGLVFAKICIDHNIVPELTTRKPYTPIFWYYKKGEKDKPVLYEGKLKKEALIEFIKNIKTQERS